MSSAGQVYAHNISRTDAHGIHYQETTIAHAAILTLGGTPVTIAGVAPTANTIQLVYAIVDFIVETASGGGNTAYTNLNNLQIRHAAAAGNLEATLLALGWIDQTSDGSAVGIPTTGTVRKTKSVSTSATLNKLILYNAGGSGSELTGGAAGNTLRVKCWYRLIPTTYTV